MPGTKKFSSYHTWQYRLSEKEPPHNPQLLVKDYPPHFPYLARSAHGPQRCSFCSLIRRALLSRMIKEDVEFQNILAAAENGINISFESFHWIGDLADMRSCKGESACKGDLYLYITLTPEGKTSTGGGSLTFRIDPCQNHRGADSLLRWLRLEPSFTGPARFSAEVVRWAKKQIQQPVEKQFATGIFCPKRLIDVQSHPAKLVLMENLPDIMAPVYAALSYCWGTREDAQGQLKTTRETISERMHGIHDRQMTATLKDAIAATRVLSIPYLWIDALCILQGDDEDAQRDWESQSVLMTSIFGHAHVTLGALSSSACHEHFLNHPYDVSWHWRSKISPDASGLMRATYVVHQSHQLICRPRRHIGRTMDFYDDYLTDSIWTRRGWTYQEATVSKRFLAFGKTSLMLFVHPHIVVAGDEKPTKWGNVMNNINQLSDTHTLGWSSIVEWYTKRHVDFTKPSDVLPALSGLAAWKAGESKDLSDQDYLAGLWRPWLPIYLLWRTGKPRSVELAHLIQDLSHQDPYICPSWSWPMCKDVRLHGLTLAQVHKAMCKVVDVKVTVRGKNPFGQVSSGYIILTGRMSRLPSDLRRRRWEIQPSPHTVAAPPKCWKWVAKVERTDRHGAWEWRLDWDTEEDVVPRGQLMMILIGADKESQKEVLEGLILHPVGESRPGVYVRVGSFQRRPKEWKILDRWNAESRDKFLPKNGAHPHLPIPFFGRRVAQTIEIV
ncbi:hypothetical protein RB595_007550 [Gaeumannomyces hyphopodioides]